jgi:RsiW-degrading membrane proteinase PrsW (M82 family)
MDFASFVHVLVPVRSWLKNPGWRQGLRLAMIPYALLPLLFLLLYSNSSNPSTPGWAYSLYVAPLWAVAFWLLIRPGQLTKHILAACAGITVWDLIWMHAVTVPINDQIRNPGTIPRALAVGLNEEITKALPVLVLAMVLLKTRSIKWDVRMWMWLGTFSGLVFGVTEASMYTSGWIVTIAQHPSAVIAGVLAFAERVFVDGFQHAIWAGIAGFFMGMAVNYQRRRTELIAFGIAVPAVLHALNDWVLSALSSSTLWVGVQTLSLLLFLGYTMSAHSIERHVRRSPMFRGESILAEDFSASSELPGNA